jgi:hypothetical protein
VADVVANFPATAIADGVPEFIRLCREAVATPDARRVQAGLRQAAENTWDSVVAKMERHIETALAAKIGREFRHETQMDLVHRSGLVPLPAAVAAS